MDLNFCFHQKKIEYVTAALDRTYQNNTFNIELDRRLRNRYIFEYFFVETKVNIHTFNINHFIGHKHKIWLTREPASTAHSISTDQKKRAGEGG